MADYRMISGAPVVRGPFQAAQEGAMQRAQIRGQEILNEAGQAELDYLPTQQMMDQAELANKIRQTDINARNTAHNEQKMMVEDSVRREKRKLLSRAQMIANGVSPEDADEITRLKDIEDARELMALYPNATAGVGEYGDWSIEESLSHIMGNDDIVSMMFPEGFEPLDAMAKLEADRRAGRITPEQYRAQYRKLTTVTGQTPTDAEALAAMTDSQAGKRTSDLLGRRDKTLSVVGEGAVLLDMLRENPRAAGFTGILAERAGGLASLLAGAQFGDDVSEMISGMSQEEISAARTDMKLYAASILSLVTGDYSGRYTDREAATAKSTAGAIDDVSLETLTKNGPQVIGQIQSLTSYAVRGLYRDLIANGVLDVDLDTPEGINDLGAELEALGLDEKHVETTIRAIRDSRRTHPTLWAVQQ